MGGWYRSVLERGEVAHEAVVRAVEESKGRVGDGGVAGEERGEEGKGERGGKGEEEVARELGVEVNEEGEVVDKRELLKAGLNAEGAAAKKVKKSDAERRGGGFGKGGREKESRDLEDMLLGKHGLSDDEEEGGGADARASKSRRLEDELLAGFGSP